MRRSMEVLSVLLVAMLAVWTPPAAGVLFPWNIRCDPERWSCIPRPALRYPPDMALLPPPEECIRPIRDVNGCLRSLFRSDASGKMQVDEECCGAVRSMEAGRCFNTVFNSVGFSMAFAPKLKAYCAPPAPTDWSLAPHI